MEEYLSGSLEQHCEECNGLAEYQAECDNPNCDYYGKLVCAYHHNCGVDYPQHNEEK